MQSADPRIQKLREQSGVVLTVKQLEVLTGEKGNTIYRDLDEHAPECIEPCDVDKNGKRLRVLVTPANAAAWFPGYLDRRAAQVSAHQDRAANARAAKMTRNIANVDEAFPMTKLLTEIRDGQQEMINLMQKLVDLWEEKKPATQNAQPRPGWHATAK